MTPSEPVALQKPASRVFDILVAGAGPAGLAFASAVTQAMGRGVSIALVDPRPKQRDGRLRTVALAPGSRRLLERIGAWEALAPQAQPILSMSIADGRVRDAVRLEQLRFDAQGDEPLAHMAFNDDLCDALSGAAARLGVETITGAASGLAAGRDMAEVTLEGGERLKARLVVAADGARSALRELADIATVGWDTAMTAIVATIAHERDHAGRAEQHFLPAGPFAILPLRGRFSSIVWNEAPADAQALLALAEEDLLRELEYRFTLKLGALSLASRVAAFPCSFRFARRFIAPRLALLADAAHVVHPLAGQGLNLGLRDVAALAEFVVERLRLGLDPGDAATLAAYQRARRFDVVSSSFGMDALNRIFANDFEPLRAARDFGLRVVDRLAPAKRMLMAEAAGDGRGAPRLLRGEPL
ncbi:MAG: 2-octaprenyl-6-methoxyphenyl hydroxylase [Bradyrhizobium sp.]|nr:MAG: 2-octaprenyl-6-methoxyphenyl hydroxylase [Bradyrhizobium sp.]